MYYERQVPNNLNLNYYPPHSIMNVKVRCHYLLTPHKISGEILVAKDSTGRYFMCPPAGSSTEGEEDSPAPPAPNQPRDQGRSPLRPNRRHARQQAIWDLLLPSPGGVSSLPGVVAQLDPGAGSTSLSAPTLSGSAVPIGRSPAPSMSIAPDVAPSSTSRQGPVTRLQRGVSKPKTYTDVEQALGDKNWTTVMDSEYQGDDRVGLVEIITLHPVL
jgi:hypothetical protein